MMTSTTDSLRTKELPFQGNQILVARGEGAKLSTSDKQYSVKVIADETHIYLFHWSNSRNVARNFTIDKVSEQGKKYFGTGHRNQTFGKGIYTATNPLGSMEYCLDTSDYDVVAEPRLIILRVPNQEDSISPIALDENDFKEKPWFKIEPEVLSDVEVLPTTGSFLSRIGVSRDNLIQKWESDGLLISTMLGGKNADQVLPYIDEIFETST